MREHKAACPSASAPVSASSSLTTFSPSYAPLSLLPGDLPEPIYVTAMVIDIHEFWGHYYADTHQPTYTKIMDYTFTIQSL